MRSQSMLALLLVLAGLPGLAAQETTTGSIAGRVVDAQNLASPAPRSRSSRRRAIARSRPIQTGASSRHFSRRGSTRSRSSSLAFARSIAQDIQVRVGQRSISRSPMHGRQRHRDRGGHGDTPVIDSVDDHDRRDARQRAAEPDPDRPPLQRHAVHRAWRQQRRTGRARPTRRLPAAAASRTATSSTA